MRLKSFRVRVFRNVIDSGDVKVEGNTCLVGKNEAGKSALVQALHRLNPAKPVPLDLLDEYPRWLKKEHEISGEIQNATPIEASYELDAKRVLSVDKFASVKGADIEDLFAPAEYLELYNATFSKTLKEADIPGTDRIVKRIARKEGQDFDHGRVAGHFLANQASLIPKLEPATVDRFEKVIKALVKALPAD